MSVCGRVVCEQSVNVDLCWPQIKNLVKIRADEWLLVEKIINQNGSNQLNVREDKMVQGQDSNSSSSSSSVLWSWQWIKINYLHNDYDGGAEDHND